jgi:hypothetical protein
LALAIVRTVQDWSGFGRLRALCGFDMPVGRRDLDLAVSSWCWWFGFCRTAAFGLGV